MFRLKNSITSDLKKKETRLEEIEIDIQILILGGILPDMYLPDNEMKKRKTASQLLYRHDSTCNYRMWSTVYVFGVFAIHKCLMRRSSHSDYIMTNCL